MPSAITITHADSPYDCGCNNAVILLDTSAGAIIVRLPPANNAAGKSVRFTKITNDSNAITFTPFGTDVIDQKTSFSFTDKLSYTIKAELQGYWGVYNGNPKLVVDVKDFGAVGDGSTDDTVAVQNAIDHVWGLGGGVVNFSRGNYRIASESTVSATAALDLRSNITLTGERQSSTITIIASTTQYRGIICGVGPSSDRAVAGTIATGNTFFWASSTGLVSDLVANDWLIFTIYDPTYVDVVAIDFNQVLSVSGTTVNVTTPFQQTFVPGSGQTLYFERMNLSGTPVQNIEVSNLNFKLESSGLATDAALFSLYWTRGIVFTNNVCSVVPGTHGTAFLALHKCADVKIFNNRFVTLPSTVGTIAGGVELAESTDVTFDNNRFESNNSTVNGTNLRVNFGTNRFQVTNNCINNAQDFGIITYAHPYNGVISKNTIGIVVGIGTGIALGGAENIVVSDNILLGPKTVGAGYGIASTNDTLGSTTLVTQNNIIHHNIVNTRYTTPYNCYYKDRVDNWQDFPYGLLQFKTIAVGGTWTVQQADVTYLRYLDIGRSRIIDFFLDTTSVGGTLGTGIYIQFPFNFAGYASKIRVYATEGGSTAEATAQVSGDSILFTKIGSNWIASTNQTTVWGQIITEF